MERPPRDPGRAAILVFALVAVGFLLHSGKHHPGPPELPIDHPDPGFTAIPGILGTEADGLPKDLRLVVTEVERTDGKGRFSQGSADEALVHVRLVGADGKPVSSDRWRMIDPDAAALEGAPGIVGHPYSFSGMFFQHVNESGAFFVRLCGLPEREIVIPRISLDVTVIPVERQGRLRWRVEEGKDFAVTFLDQVLFVNFEPGFLSWGAPSRGRFHPPTTKGTCLQGVLEDYSILDAFGRDPPDHGGSGRSWGFTHEVYLGLEDVPAFPLRVEARWRRCGPTRTCRFVLERVRIPGPPPTAPVRLLK